MWLVPSHFQKINMSSTSVFIGLQNIPYFWPVVYNWLHHPRSCHTSSLLSDATKRDYQIGNHHDHDGIIKWKHFSALLALCDRNPPATGGFPSQRPVTRNIDVFVVRHPNKRVSKQSRRRWFETPLRSLWHRCSDSLMAMPMWTVLTVVTATRRIATHYRLIFIIGILHLQRQSLFWDMA